MKSEEYKCDHCGNGIVSSETPLTLQITRSGGKRDYKTKTFHSCSGPCEVACLAKEAGGGLDPQTLSQDAHRARPDLSKQIADLTAELAAAKTEIQKREHALTHSELRKLLREAVGETARAELPRYTVGGVLFDRLLRRVW